MGWIVVLQSRSPRLSCSALCFGYREGDNGWRDQAEGLRERLEHDGLLALDTVHNQPPR